MFSRPWNVVLIPLAATTGGTTISIIRKNGSAMLVAPFVQLNAADRCLTQRPPPVLIGARQTIRFDCSLGDVPGQLRARLTGANRTSRLSDSPVSWEELNQLTCCFVL